MFGSNIMDKFMSIAWKKYDSFTLVETIVSLWVDLFVGFLLCLLFSSIFRLQDKLRDDTFVQWHVAMEQIDNKLAGCEIVKLSDREIVYKVGYKEMSIRPSGYTLVESRGDRRGYKPILFNIRDVKFIKNNQKLTIEGEFINGKKYQHSYKIHQDVS